jgi:Ca2+-binding RTX toxin-like protein
MLTRCAAAACLLTVPGIVAIGAQPAAAAETCNGQTATLVGSPGTTIEGTSGDDVIVTNGSLYVSGRAGNDTICTTNSVPRQPQDGYSPPAVVVDAGLGNDFVDRRGDADPEAWSEVFGADTFHGSEAGDHVIPQYDSGPQSIATGGGPDQVDVNYFFQAFSVDLGSGDDKLFATPEERLVPPAAPQRGAEPASHVTGGPGDDLLYVWLEPGRWRLDARSGVLDQDLTPHLGFDGIEAYNLNTERRGARLEFRGTSRDEVLSSTGLSRLGAEMRGGDDQVLVDAGDRGVRATVGAGPGRDSLVVAGSRTSKSSHRQLVTVDLAQGAFSVGSGATNRATGFEDAGALSGWRVLLIGGEGGNELRSSGCRLGTARGGAGPDRIRVTEPPTGCHKGELRLRAFGEGGNDVLVGGDAPDVLVGGSGHDRARGGKRSDRCEAEVRKLCERP